MSHRTAQRRLRGLAAAVLTVGLAVSVPAAAEATATPPSPVGGSTSRSAPRTYAVTAQALAAVTCRAAEGFTRVNSGALYRLTDSAPTGAANTMSELGQVGSGWTGTAFAWVAAGGDGVVYGLTWTGDLKWYRYSTASSGWVAGSGRVVGRGFTPRTKMINIALGGDGRFYMVKTDGKLVLYRHTGRLTGAATWANPTGWTIGSGWTGNEIIIPNGDGTIYRQYQSALYWYRHTDPAAGAVTWSARRTIGSGWRFYDVLPAGAGVLYATQGGSGTVVVYRHGDPVGGSNGWAAATGVVKMTARPDSFGISVDPLACSLA